jgi:S-adenosylmethionine/arginine decarboxylase-like enzyme
MDIRGEHVILDIIFNTFPNDLKDTINRVLKDNNICVVNYIEHLFEPQGVTACWVLSASSCVIHTYPEHKYLSLDCYTCSGEGSAMRVVDDFIAYYNQNIDKLNIKKINRGEI